MCLVRLAPPRVPPRPPHSPPRAPLPRAASACARSLPTQCRIAPVTTSVSAATDPGILIQAIWSARVRHGLPAGGSPAIHAMTRATVSM